LSNVDDTLPIIGNLESYKHYFVPIYIRINGSMEKNRTRNLSVENLSFFFLISQRLSAEIKFHELSKEKKLKYQ
jgi:hypothetical protein